MLWTPCVHVLSALSTGAEYQRGVFKEEGVKEGWGRGQGQGRAAV